MTREHDTRDSYFEAIYQVADPYGSATRWYERRKQEVLLASLPRPRFGRAFEPACGTGVLTTLLAARCDQVFASDFSAGALSQARRVCGGLANVRIEQHRVPEQWPKAENYFDLIVVSELCSFLSEKEVLALRARCASSLGEASVLVACDWRWPFRERVLDADRAHALLQGAGLARVALHEEQDFILSIWSGDQRSVAQHEAWFEERR